MTEPELPDLEALWAADHGLPAAGAEREAMWQVSTDPVRMLDMLEPAFADDKISDRKIRLYVCACCRRVWHQLSAETRRNHVELTERFVDGKATREEFAVVDWDREKPKELAIARCCRWDFDPYGGHYYIYHEVREALRRDKPGVKEAAAQAALLRDIFRVPYPRRVTVRRAWKSNNVVGLAQAIYDERAFNRMPILADALEDAGCQNTEILNHCRNGEDHVRGCWVVDALLGMK